MPRRVRANAQRLGDLAVCFTPGEQSAGREDVTVDADGLASGVYFLRLHADSQVLTRKITVVR